jgi:hypothetical protein
MRARAIIILPLVVLATLLSALPAAQPTTQLTPAVAGLVNAVDVENVLAHVRYFSSLGSRVPGYEGFYRAADYIKAFWAGLGFDVREERFEVTVPMVKRSSVRVEIPGTGIVEVPAYPLWPNHVNPSPYTSPASGDFLVYAGSGDLDGFNNVNVNGSFALMEFNCRWYWKYAAMLGAKGVLFVEPEDTVVTEAVQKTFSVPLNFPRLLIPRKEGEMLKEVLKKHGKVKIWVDVRVEWERVTVSNIIAEVKGVDETLSKEVAIVGAYYDSWSITPQLAPGATDAIGIGYLLEFSKVLKSYPPRRTVWLVAFAGHYQVLAGAREFVDSHFGELGTKLKMMVTLNLASDSDILVAYGTGPLYTYSRPRDILPQYDRWLTSIVQWSIEVERATGEPARLIDGVRWSWPPWVMNSPPFDPYPRYFEAEVFTKACYGGGLGFVTTNALRKYQWTFMDTAERLNAVNIARQIRVLTPIIYNSVNMERIPYSLYPRRFVGAIDHGIVSAVLQLGKYNVTIHMFNDYAHKDAVIFVAMGYYPVYTLVMKPNATGADELKGIGAMPPTFIDAQAYVVDPETGRILSATDTGPFGTGVFVAGRAFTVQVARGHRYIPVFNCSSIALIGFFDPLLLSGPQSLGVEPLNFISHSYLVWRDVLTAWPEAMVFVEPGTPVEVVVRSWGLGGRVVAVLNNASAAYPSGRGYILKWGDTLTLSVLDAIMNTYYLAKGRGEFLRSRMTANPRMLAYLDKMMEYTSKALEARAEGRWGDFVRSCMVAWHYVIGAYDSTISLLFDVSQTAVFFFFLSVAFALLASRLVSRTASGKRQVLIAVATLVAANAVVAAIHPGYVISNNVWMLISGISVAFLILIMVYSVVDEFNIAVSELSVSILGFHTADVRRSTVFSASISMGLENLRKRALRTALALVSIVATVTALVLFTTVGMMLVLHGRSVGEAPYTGVLIRRPFVQLYMPFYETYIDVFPALMSEDAVKFRAMPRAWIYPAGQSLFLAWGPNASGIRCILAITPEESKMLEPALNGTYFISPDVPAIIMTPAMAKRLSAVLGRPVDLGSTISIYGIDMTVVGLIDRQSAIALLYRDLDGMPVLPPDPIGTSTAGVYSPLDPDAIVIVPYGFALRHFNSLPNVIRVSTDSASEDFVRRKAYDTSLLVPFDIAYGVKGGVASVVTKRDIYAFGGVESTVLPLVLSALSILTMMMGAIYERRREIYTLTTVGAAPSHIETIFLVEGATLAFIGAYLGYVIGAVTLYVVWNLGVIPPGLIPNVSSGVVLIVLAVIISTVILSTLYPAVRASRMATPSLLRRWTVESRPRGDTWEVRMPFVAAREEALGLLAFLSEYMEAVSSERERSRVFMLVSPPQLTTEEESYRLTARLHMAPFDTGIIQDAAVVARRLPGGSYAFDVVFRRLQGPESIWLTSTRAFIGELRKQFLAWRALSPSEKTKYVERAKSKISAI